MTAGILLTTVGTAAIGRVVEVWHLYAAYAVMAVAFGMGSAVSVSSMLSRWFIEHRSKAMTISSTGVSLGGSVLVPVGGILLAHYFLLGRTPRVDDLYASTGPYGRWGGFSPAGVIAWVGGSVTYFAAAGIGSTLPALAVAIVTYVVLARRF